MSTLEDFARSKGYSIRVDCGPRGDEAPVREFVLTSAHVAELAGAQAEIARLRGALEVLETDAHFIFNNPPGETSQDVRDVIEWFAGSIRVALEQAK